VFELDTIAPSAAQEQKVREPGAGSEKRGRTNAVSLRIN
jgi:hypothetical protein